MLLNHAVPTLPANLLPIAASADETRFGGLPGGLLRSAELIMPIKFMINPIARARGGQRLWSMLQEACTRLGYVEGKDYSVEWTRSGHAVEQVRRAAAEWDRVVAVGGDGTVRAVAEGLFKAGTGAALGVIPQGTG